MLRRTRSFFLRLAAALGASLLAAAAASAGARSLLATCADGSVVVARQWKDVRCEGAMPVEPDALALGVHHSRQPDQRALRRAHEAVRERDLDEQLAAVVRERRASAVLRLAPAERWRLARRIAAGEGVFTLAREIEGAGRVHARVVYSPEIEARVREQAARPPAGPIVVFSLEPAAALPRAGLPAFAQGGVTVRPRLADPGRMGWLSTAVGDPRAPLLGWVALPAGFDPARPMALFWGDAVSAARLAR